MITVRTLYLDRAKIKSLGKEKKNLLICSGHALNQIAALYKITAFASRASSEAYIEKIVNAAQSQIFVRLLIGTLAETITFLQKDGRKKFIETNYIQKMTPKAIESYEIIKGSFGGNNYLQRVRNKFTFHFPDVKDTEAAFDKAPADEDWSIYLSEDLSNSFWVASETVMSAGASSVVENKSYTEAFETLIDEAVKIANSLNRFLPELLQLIVEESYSDNQLPFGKKIVVVPKINGATFEIPYFVDMPE